MTALILLFAAAVTIACAMWAADEWLNYRARLDAEGILNGEHLAELKALNAEVDAEEAEWDAWWKAVPRDNVRWLPNGLRPVDNVVPLRSVPSQREPGSAS